MELHYSQTSNLKFEPLQTAFSSTYESKSTLTAYELPDENALEATFEA